MKLTIAARKYLEHTGALGRSDRTMKEYRKRLLYFRRFAAIGKVSLVRDVSSELIRDYHADMMKRGLQASSRGAFIKTVRNFLSWAHDRGMILSDVATRVEIPKPGFRLPPTPLSLDEIEELAGLCDLSTTAGKRNHCILEMLYGCGLRRSELLKLNFGDLDFRAATVFVKGKGAKERLLPVNDVALRAVAAYVQASGGRAKKSAPLLLTHSSQGRGKKRLDESGLVQMFRRLDKRFSKHVHPHLLRHTCAVHMLKGGADIRYVQALLGHESPETTALYLGLVKDDLKKAYDAAIGAILAD